MDYKKEAIMEKIIEKLATCIEFGKIDTIF